MHFNMCNLDQTKLPTKRHLMEYLLFVRHKGTPKLNKNQRLEVYLNDVCQEIINLWQRTKIPLLSTTKKVIMKCGRRHENMSNETGINC